MAAKQSTLPNTHRRRTRAENIIAGGIQHNLSPCERCINLRHPCFRKEGHPICSQCTLDAKKCNIPKPTIPYLKKRTKKKIKRRIAGLKRCTKRIERHLESLQSTIKALSDQLGQLRFERPGGVKDCEQSVEQLLSFNPTTPEQQQQQQQQGQHESMEQLNSFGRDMATFHDLDFNIPTFLGSGMLN